MKPSASSSIASRLVAGVHQAGEECRIVVARMGGARPVLVEARTTRSLDEVASILAKHDDPVRVIRVLPASSTICRTCAIPKCDGEQYAAALVLHAEAHSLGGAVPPHRLGMAMLDGAIGETTRMGLIIAWPERLSIRAIPGLEDVDHAPEVAALAALMNGDRPDRPLLAVDRLSGTVSFGLTCQDGATFRAARDGGVPDALPDAWFADVDRMMIETALSAGHTPEFARRLLESHRARLLVLDNRTVACLLPPDTITAAAIRVDGVRPDEAWFDAYGIALGAVLATSGPLDDLCRLRVSEPAIAPSMTNQLITTLSRRGTAAAVLVGCMLLLGILPVVSAALRLTILSMRHGDGFGNVEHIEAQLAMHDAIGSSAYSMTKVLSDIMCAAPQGIEFDTVRVDTGNGTFSVSGSALDHGDEKGDAIILRMMEHLDDTKVFSRINLNWDPPTELGKYEFAMSASIKRPHVRLDLPLKCDFGRWTLADRREGVGAPMPGAPTVDAEGRLAHAPADIPEPPFRTHKEPGSRVLGTGSGIDDMRKRAHIETPAPLTEGQIEVMSIAEIKARLDVLGGPRSHKRKNGAEVDANDAALKAEFVALFGRLGELKANRAPAPDQ